MPGQLEPHFLSPATSTSRHQRDQQQNSPPTKIPLSSDIKLDACEDGRYMDRLILQPPKRRRSRRLRKKLRIEEFQEFGFEYELTWPTRPSAEEQERFIDQLLADVVEPRGLSMGGGMNAGFISARRGSPSEEDRSAFEVWLRRWLGVLAVKVGPLRDAWYDEPGTGPEGAA